MFRCCWNKFRLATLRIRQSRLFISDLISLVSQGEFLPLAFFVIILDVVFVCACLLLTFNKICFKLFHERFQDITFVVSYLESYMEYSTSIVSLSIFTLFNFRLHTIISWSLIAEFMVISAKFSGFVVV